MAIEVAVIEDARKARAVLRPLRQQILAAAQQPCSSTAIAAALGLPRQRINYHVRQLAAAGFLKRAGRRQRRGLVEQRWVVASRSIVIAPRMDEALTVNLRALSPSLSTPASASPTSPLPSPSTSASPSPSPSPVPSPSSLPSSLPSTPDHTDVDLGATYLLALASTVQREVAEGARTSRRTGKTLPTLALDAELRFASAAQRAKFAETIQQAIRDAIAEHSTANASGPTFRLAFGVYPIPEKRTR